MNLCIFCGSSSGKSDIYRQAAIDLATAVVGRGWGIVYGGGNVGLMGIVADAALEAGGKVVGVIPRHLMERELGHSGVTELHVVGSMHERKALMADFSDAFVAVPGGFGTLDEFCEILTWGQLGLHAKPCGILNTNGFYDSFLGQCGRAVADGFLRPEHRELIRVATEPEALLLALEAAPPPPMPKWLDEEDR